MWHGTPKTLWMQPPEGHQASRKDDCGQPQVLWAAFRGQTVRVTEQALQYLLVPGCFLVAGLIGMWLGTPRAVSGGLAAVGGAHVMSFAVAGLAIASSGAAGAAANLASQWLFAAGFAAIVWLAAAYPQARPSRKLVGFAGALVLVGPLLGALSGPTPTVIQPSSGAVLRGPLFRVLPEGIAALSVAPIMALPVIAVVLFAVRYWRGGPSDRRAMRWPLAALAVMVLVIVAGSVAGQEWDGAQAVAFLIAAPVVPLALAFGPVHRRMDALSADLEKRLIELNQSRHRLSVAAEQERLRLERDLHDGAQQELIALMAQIEVARSSADPAVRAAALDAAAGLSQGAYETVRGVAHGVRPAALQDLGLTAAIRDLVEALPIAVDTELDDSPAGTLPPDAEAAALFVVSEALANAMKHADASRMRVRLHRHRTKLEVAVEDDGVGGADPTGSGLRGLIDRVEAADGRIEIDSQPGMTRLTVRFEVDK